MKRLVVRVFALLLISVSVVSAAEVYVYNWSEYMPEEVLSRFEKETGIKVVYTTYDSNEAMYAKVKLLDGAGYDVIFPSTYYVDKMRRENLLLPVSRGKLSNWQNLNESLLDKSYDPENRFSVPYLWGSTAIGVNRAYIPEGKVASFADLWNPEFRGRVMVTNDMREVFGMALSVLGYSGNTTDSKEIEAAYHKLRALLPNIRLFAAENQKQVLLSEEALLGTLWNGEAYMAALENPEIDFVYPEEGAVFWVDNMAIPKGAKNVEAAHAFMDFLLKPEIAKLISEEIGYATPNRAAMNLLDPQVVKNPTVYPADDVVEKGEFQNDIGDAILVYQKFWEKLKTGN